MLAAFVTRNRDEIVQRCRTKVMARGFPPPAPAEMELGIPLALDQLAEALGHRPERPSTGETDTGAAHGHDLQLDRLTISQVVRDYGDVCEVIVELAKERAAAISAEDFRALDRWLDDAIASAVAEYGLADQSMRAADAAGEDERFAILAHELRNLVNIASLSFEVLKTGNVGVSGSTATVLQRSLSNLRDLANRSVAEVRLRHGLREHAPVPVAEFINELIPAASLDARARGLLLQVRPGDPDVVVNADRQILAGVVSNLLQNAFKFTRPRTTVTLQATATPERVLIEVADECGGLPAGNVEELFKPFEQRSVDRTGLGLGLAISRRGAGANSGRVSARDMPGHGCVFTVDLPRLVTSAAANLSRSRDTRTGLGE